MTAGCLPVYGRRRRRSPLLCPRRDERWQSHWCVRTRVYEWAKALPLFPLCVNAQCRGVLSERETKNSRVSLPCREDLFNRFFPHPFICIIIIPRVPLCVCVYYLNSKSREDFEPWGGGRIGDDTFGGWQSKSLLSSVYFMWHVISIPICLINGAPSLYHILFDRNANNSRFFIFIYLLSAALYFIPIFYDHRHNLC